MIANIARNSDVISGKRIFFKTTKQQLNFNLIKFQQHWLLLTDKRRFFLNFHDKLKF